MAKRQSRQFEIVPEPIDSLVHIVRGQRVMLDSDLARLYGVTTMRLNEQVRGIATGFQKISRISLHSKSLRL